MFINIFDDISCKLHNTLGLLMSLKTILHIAGMCSFCSNGGDIFTGKLAPEQSRKAVSHKI